MAHKIGYKIVIEINDEYRLESAIIFSRKILDTKESSYILNEFAANCLFVLNDLEDADFDITDVTDCVLLASDGNLFEYYDVDFARVVESKIDITISSEFDDCKLLHMGR